ncbi:hypothetical protein NEIPOLOT_02290 [Neisseria polysaccharea ATCC 43768]|nr:hypothetical protein NEIPOLOT_02290 [Neisseria polysaccharea ATCC 43768]
MKIPSFLYACTERKAQIVTETAAVPKSGIRCAAGAGPDENKPKPLLAHRLWGLCFQMPSTK